MTLPIHIAVVSTSAKVPLESVTAVAAAVNKQVIRDFGPLWDVIATVDAFPDPAHVPADYWPVLVQDTIDDPGALGYHDDKLNRPYALVVADPGWQLTVSHEVLEMLGDPTGNRTVAGQSPDPTQGRVLFLVEVCDPCEADALGYGINGVPVSDFITPHYYDPIRSDGVRYSYSGTLIGPRTILPGGYLSWFNPSNRHWYQQTYFTGNATQTRDLGARPADVRDSLRSWIDRLTNKEALTTLRPTMTSFARLGGRGGTGTIDADSAAAAAMAATLESIEELKGT